MREREALKFSTSVDEMAKSPKNPVKMGKLLTISCGVAECGKQKKWKGDWLQ